MYFSKLLSLNNYRSKHCKIYDFVSNLSSLLQRQHLRLEFQVVHSILNENFAVCTLSILLDFFKMILYNYLYYLFREQGQLTILNVRNHVELGVSLRVLKTQTESHVRRPVVWTNRWQIWVFFLGFSVGWLEFVTQAFGDSLKLSSTGLAIQWLIRRSEFIASYKKLFLLA